MTANQELRNKIEALKAAKAAAEAPKAPVAPIQPVAPHAEAPKAEAPKAAAPKAINIGPKANKKLIIAGGVVAGLVAFAASIGGNTTAPTVAEAPAVAPIEYSESINDEGPTTEWKGNAYYQNQALNGSDASEAMCQPHGFRSEAVPCSATKKADGTISVSGFQAAPIFSAHSWGEGYLQDQRGNIFKTYEQDGFTYVHGEHGNYHFAF